MARPTNEKSPDDATIATRTRGPQLAGIRLAGDPDRWSDAGFTLTGDGSIGVGSTLILPDGSDRGPVGFAFHPTTGTPEIDGIPVSSGSDLEWSGSVVPSGTDGAGSGTHPNGIVSIDHVVIATDDRARTVTAFEEAGFPPRRTVTTERFGTPLLQTFLWAGDVMLEVIGPPDPVPMGATVPAAKLFGVTFVTTDMDRTVETLGGMIGEPRAAVQPGRTIATLRTKELGIRTRLAVMTPHVPDRG